MNKLFTMARQAGRNMMAGVAAMLAMGATAWPPASTGRCRITATARQRLTSAVRGGAATSPSEGVGHEHQVGAGSVQRLHAVLQG